jgi:YbbR domain-containing protein
MSGAASHLWHRLIGHAPRKLGALLLACLVWIVVTTDNETIAQRSLLVPIVIDGVSADVVVVGLPQLAEVTVSGPAARIDRLRPESFEAVLDLTGVSGNFQAQVVVAPPQGMVLERVVPSEVIGMVEAVVRARLPVIASVMGDLGPDRRELIDVNPATAEVSGRAALVARAVAIAVPVPSSELERIDSLRTTGFAIDAAGRPLADVGVDVGEFEVRWQIDTVWLSRRLPLTLEMLASDRWDALEGLPESILLVGLASRVNELEEVVADVELPTGERPAGRYTVLLRPRLPEGVVVAEPLSASARYTPPPALLE